MGTEQGGWGWRESCRADGKSPVQWGYVTSIIVGKVIDEKQKALSYPQSFHTCIQLPFSSQLIDFWFSITRRSGLPQYPTLPLVAATLIVWFHPLALIYLIPHITLRVLRTKKCIIITLQPQHLTREGTNAWNSDLNISTKLVDFK